MAWPSSLPPSLVDRLQSLLADPRLPHACAAFDADGTLWAGDVGELLLQAMIGLGRAPQVAWARYEALMAQDPAAGCAYCVQLLRGTPLHELQRWSTEFVGASQHGPVYAPIVELARTLAERGCEVFVVSGSNAWTVQAGVDVLGLAARVLGLTCRVDDGVLTGDVAPPITCGAGKVEALRRASSRPLILAAGNALYDVELLTQAELALAVAPRGRESPLRTVAAARGWPVLEV